MKTLSHSIIAITMSSLITSAAWSQQTQSVYEGFTQPRYDIMVAATEIGRLDEVLVEVGDHVEAGQTMARLENSLQNSSVKIARMQAELVGDIEAARAEAMLHRARVEQLRELADDKMVRPNELKRAEADLKIAEAREIAAVEQQQLRKLELERYELQLARRLVIAPMGGVISKIFHQPGEYITPGDPAVVRLLVIDQLFGIFNVPAEDVKTMHPGADVRVFLRSSAKTIGGTITSIAPDIDGESGTIRVKVTLDNKDGELRAGDRCTMRLGKYRRVAKGPTPNPHIIYEETSAR